MLQLVTLPNLFINWYLVSHEVKNSEGEIEINLDLLNKFKHDLKNYNINLQFSYGAWRSLNMNDKYDLILSSETIYQSSSLQSLVNLIKSISNTNTEVLISCKSVYFGVGGGVHQFINVIENVNSGKCQIIWASNDNSGVIRNIIKVKL